MISATSFVPGSSPPVLQPIPPAAPAKLSEAFPTPPLRLENCPRDQLFWFLVDKGIIDAQGNLIAKIPDTLPPFTEDQIQRLQETLSHPIEVCNHKGASGFKITIGELIQYIQLYYSAVPKIKEIEFVGGWVSKILNLPLNTLSILRMFNIPGLEEFLKEHPLEENYRNPPDKDLRIDLSGTPKDERDSLYNFILEKLIHKTGRTKENLEANFLTDHANPQDANLGNCFLMFGLGDRKFNNVEVIAFDRMRVKHIFSSEIIKVSVKSKGYSCPSPHDPLQIRAFYQALFDRILQRGRITSGVIDHFGWYKSLQHAVQGTVCSRAEELQFMRDKLPSNDLDLLKNLQSEAINFIEKHCMQETLYAISYLYNLYSELVEINKSHLFGLLWSVVQAKVNVCALNERNYPSETLFYEIFKGNHPLDEVSTLIHPFAWLNSKGKKSSECKTHVSLKGNTPFIEWILKGSNSLPHSLGKASEYSFWTLFDPNNCWKRLVKSPSKPLEELFFLFIKDFEFDPDLKITDGVDWKEEEIAQSALELIKSDSQAHLRLGYWLMLILASNNFSLKKELLKHTVRYFTNEQNPLIKDKAVSILNKMKVLADASAIGKQKEFPNQSRWIIDLLNDPEWSSLGFALWNEVHPDPTIENLKDLAHTKVKAEILLKVIEDFESKGKTEILNSFFTCLPPSSLAFLSPQSQQKVLDHILQLGHLDFLVAWISVLHPQPILTNPQCERILKIAANSSEQVQQCIRHLVSQHQFERYWKFAKVSQLQSEISQCIKTDLKSAFNWIESIEKEGYLKSHLEEFRVSIITAIEAFAAQPIKEYSIHWEYILIRKLIVEYPALSPDGAHIVLGKYLAKLQKIVKTYEKDFHVDWYVGVCNDYFGLLLKECNSQLSRTLSVYECLFSYLSEMNHPGRPLPESQITHIHTNFEVVLMKFAEDNEGSKILNIYRVCHLRRIPLQLQPLVRKKLTEFLVLKAENATQFEVQVTTQLIQEYIQHNLEDITEKDLPFIMALLQTNLQIQTIIKVFTKAFLVATNKDNLLNLMVNKCKTLLAAKMIEEAQLIYNLPEFEPKRIDVAEDIFNVVVRTDSSDQELERGLNLLTSVTLPLNLWSVLLLHSYSKASPEIFHKIWIAFKAVDVKLSTDIRAECLLYAIKGIFRCGGLDVLQLIQHCDHITAAFYLPGSEKCRNQAHLEFLKGALTYLQANPQETALINLVYKTYIHFSPTSTFTAAEKDALSGVALTLIELRINRTEVNVIEELWIDLKSSVERSSSHHLRNRQKKIFEALTTVCLTLPKNESIELAQFEFYKAIEELENFDPNVEHLLTYCIRTNIRQHLRYAGRVLTKYLINCKKAVPESLKILIKEYLNNHLLKSISDSKTFSKHDDEIFRCLHPHLRTKVLTPEEFLALSEKAFIEKLYLLLSLNDKTLLAVQVIEDLFGRMFNTCKESFVSFPFFRKIFEFLGCCFEKKYYFIMSALASNLEYYYRQCIDPSQRFKSNVRYHQPPIGYQEYVTTHCKELLDIKQYKIEVLSLVLNIKCKIDKSYCLQIIKFKKEILQFFVNLLITKKNLTTFERAYLLDFNHIYFQPIFFLFKHLSIAEKNEALNLYEKFFFSVKWNDQEFSPPHTGNVVVLSGVNQVFTNLNGILSSLFEEKSIKDVEGRFVEYMVYGNFNEAALHIWDKCKYEEKYVLEGLQKFCERNIKDPAFVMHILKKIPSVSICKDILKYIFLLEQFLKVHYQKFQGNLNELQLLIAPWSNRVAAESIKPEGERIHKAFSNFLFTREITADFIFNLIRVYIHSLLNLNHKEALRFSQELFKLMHEFSILENARAGQMIQKLKDDIHKKAESLK